MKSKSKEVQIVLEPLKIEVLKLRAVGTSPLVLHAWDEKAIEMMLLKQTQPKKAIKREKKVPHEQFRGALQTLKVGKKVVPAIPAHSLKKSAVLACRFVDKLPMTEARGLIFVKPYNSTGLLPIDTDSVVKVEDVSLANGRIVDKIYYTHIKKELKMGVSMRRDMVRLATGVADIRFRPHIETWSIDFEVEYNAGILDAEAIVNLFSIAGFHCGLGEMRKERGGNYGAYIIEARK